MSFNALGLRQHEGKTQAQVESLELDALPAGDVLIKVDYSSLNYKDGLAITGKGKIVRDFPMVPGIDLAGEVIESTADAYPIGSQVILTGWSVGERYWGGYAQYMRVQSKWLVPLPAGLSTREAMILGTAGLTAQLCVQRLQNAGVTPDQGPVIVTGASGGVGSLAVSLLAQQGFKVHALSTKAHASAQLKTLGAEEVILWADFMQEAPKMLEKSLWAAGVDTLGGDTLAKVLAQTQYNACIAAVGLAQSPTLNTSVMPFILRGASLLGVDSVMQPYAQRLAAWEALAKNMAREHLQSVAAEISLAELPEYAEAITEGKIRGRVLVKL